MAVAQSMGPERVCPEEPGPPEAPDGATGWSGDEEEEEEGEGGGYLYQPLSQEPEQGPGETDHAAATAGSAETGPGLQERLQVAPSVSRWDGDLGRGSGAAAWFRGYDSRCPLYSADAGAAPARPAVGQRGGGGSGSGGGRRHGSEQPQLHPHGCR